MLKTHDLKENNKYQHLKDELSADVTDIRPYLQHRSEDWKEARKNILNASEAGVLTGHLSLTRAQGYWKSAIQGESIDDNQGFINKLATEWGTVCEDCARVTYYDSRSDYMIMIQEYGQSSIKHCIKDMFGCSQDDIVMICLE